MDNKQSESAAAVSPQTELEHLKSQRDREPQPELVDGEDNPDFNPFRDCDRPLAAGTVVQLGGVDVRILNDVPAMAPEFRNEAVFAEHLAASGNAKSFAANAPHLRGRYNRSGALLGVNEDHPLNKLDARIAELEAQEEVKVAAEKEAELKAKAVAAEPEANPKIEPESQASVNAANAQIGATETIAPSTEP